jgi:hypothetical protein
MGVWGPGVFADDLACEVREQYRALLGDGYEGAAATDALVETFQEVLHHDEYSAAVFWLGLAVVQWRSGRLEDRIKVRALEAIEGGAALRPFQEEPALLRARRKELSKVVALLNSPQRNPSRVRKRFQNSCDWEPGDLIAFRLRSGRNVIFRVIGHWTDTGGTSPVVEVLDWCGLDIPEAAALQNLEIRSIGNDVPHGLEQWIAPRRSQFMIGEVSRRRIPDDRISRLRVKLTPSQEVGGFSVWLWRTIDQELEREFGYR